MYQSKHRGDERGIALAVVVIVFAVVSVLGLSVLAMASSETNQTARNQRYNEAYYLADSAARVVADRIYKRIREYEEVYTIYDGLPDGSAKDAKRSELITAKAALDHEIIPSSPSAPKTAQVSVDGAVYPVTISRSPVNPGAPAGDFHLVITATAESATAGSGDPVSASAAIKMGKITLTNSTFPSDLGEGIRATSDLEIDQNGTIEANVHVGGTLTLKKTTIVGNVTAVNDIVQANKPNGQIKGNATAGGSIYAASGGGTTSTTSDFVTGVRTEHAPVPDEYYINADIVTPEMVWHETGLGLPPITERGAASGISSNLTAGNSGHYDGSVPLKAMTVDLRYGSVVLVFDSYVVPNSSQPVFTVKNSDPAYNPATNENYFYFFIKENYEYDPLTYDGMADDPNLFRVDASNETLFKNDSTIGAEVRTYIIVYNAGAQKFIYDNNPWLDPEAPAEAPLFYTIEGTDPIIRDGLSYSEYYNGISFNNGVQLNAHIIAPLCWLDFKNNNVINGTIRAARVRAENQLDFNYRPLESGSLSGLGGSPFTLYSYPEHDTTKWIRP